MSISIQKTFDDFFCFLKIEIRKKPKIDLENIIKNFLNIMINETKP